MQNTWWSKRADEIQLPADTKSTRVFYSLLRKVYGFSSFSITPLRSKENKHLIHDSFCILNRWKEHFDDLLNRPSVFNSELVESIPTKPVEDALDEEITAQEKEEAVQKLSSGKSPDMNGLLAEFFHCAGPVLMGRLTTLLQTAWKTETILEDLRNFLLVMLYKKKGPKNDYSNYRGISLLSFEGKILSRIIFRRINLHIADNVLPESQCELRSGRRTVDMIFTIRQQQGAAQRFFQVFIDLTKAFDKVNREALYSILGKLGCSEKLISAFKLFHHDMKTTLNIGGKLAEPFIIGNGVKQGDTLAPTLFALFFFMVFQLAFKDSSEGVYIHYRTTGKLFNIKSFTARTKKL